MFSTKSIYMKMCRESGMLHVLTEEERIQLQAHLRKMYVDIESVCNKYGLTVMVAYGSLLGALRHGGFIPWDDDLDLYMPREDYDKFIKIYSNNLPDNYIVYAPGSINGPIYNFAKVIDKNTSFVFPGNENLKHYKGIFVDIFPIESINEKFPLLNKAKSILAKAIIYIGGSVLQYEMKSKIYRKLMSGNATALFNYWFRQFLGFVFSVKNSQWWQNYFDGFCQYKKKTGFLHDPSGFYSWTPMSQDIFLPVKRVKFDNIEVNIPNNPNHLLEREYGDWHYIPKPDERTEHFVIELKFRV